MNRYRSSQSGLTFISVLLILTLVGFFTLLTLKIGPIYMDHYKVKSVLASMEAEPDLASGSVRSVRSTLMKRLDINMIDHITNENIAIKKRDGLLSVEVDYEVIEPIMGNLDVLVYFNDRIEVPYQ